MFLLSLLVPIALAQGTLTFDWPTPDIDLPVIPLLDTDKLCRGIAVAETSGCTKGMALTRRNCHGLMANGHGRVFASFEESQAACVELWSRKYKVFPTPELATRFTGNDSPGRWLSVVSDYYYSH